MREGRSSSSDEVLGDEAVVGDGERGGWVNEGEERARCGGWEREGVGEGVGVAERWVVGGWVKRGESGLDE